MDATTVVAGVVFSLAVCVVLVVAAKFSFREREYEEVFGHQEHATVPSAAKKASKKKKVKSKGAQSNVAADDDGKGGSGADVDGSDGALESSGDRHPHVEYDPDPVILDEPQQPAASKSKPENIPKKSILRNRSDSSNSGADIAVPSKGEKSQRGGFHRIPKDEIELKHHPELKSRRSTKAAAPVGQREAPSSTAGSDMPLQDEVIETVQRAVVYETAQQPAQGDDIALPGTATTSAAVDVETMQASASLLPAAESTKKSKAKVAAAGVVTKAPAAAVHRGEDVNSIVAAVQRCSLSKADVQLLIDTLLGKDEQSPSWTTKAQKGDPVAQLTKQLEDKDRQLLEERQQAAAVSAQLSRLGKDLQEERARRAQGEQQASERAAELGSELAALRQRMQQSHEQHLREVASLRHQSADAQEQATVIGRLSQENQQLKQAMPLPSEIKALKDQAQIVKTELAKSIQNLTTAEQKCRRLEDQAASKDLVLGKLQDDLKQQAIKMQALALEVEQARAQAVQAKQEADLLASQLKNEVHHASQTDLSNKEKDKEIQTLKQQLLLKDKNQTLVSSQAVAELDDHKARLSQSQAEVSRLQAKLGETELQAVVLKEAVARQSAAASSTGAQSQLQPDITLELEAEAERLRKAKLQLEHRQTELNEEHRQTEARLMAELSDAKRRNDEIRRKNWLLAEAVQSAEKHAEQTPELKLQLDSSRAAIDALTSQVKRLEEHNSEILESQQQLSRAASAASATIESLRSQLKQQLEREHGLKSDLEHSRQQLSQLTSESSRHRASAEARTTADLNELQKQLRSKEFEIDSLQADLEVQRQTAEAFKVKYEKADKVDHSYGSSGSANDGVTADVVQQLKSYKEELAKLKEQLSARAVSTAPLEQMRKQSGGGRPATEHPNEAGLAAAAAEDMLKQLNVQKAKNNELREKNWKLAEALNEVQKHRDSGSAAAAPTDAGFSRARQAVSRLYPALRLGSDLDDGAWLSQLEAAIREHEAGDTATSASHKRLLVQTEQALATLQDRLETEERKWQQAVAAKDCELSQLRDQLQRLSKAAA